MRETEVRSDLPTQSDVERALRDGTFVERGGGRFLCLCDSELAKTSLKSHLTSKKHLDKVSNKALCTLQAE